MRYRYSIRHIKHLIKELVFISFFTSLCIQVAHAQVLIPPQAAAVGYDTLTFSGSFDSKSVDVKKTFRSGFRWYLWNFFKYKADSSQLRFNGDGSVTILGAKGYNSAISTVGTTDNKRFVGIAFGGGGYFEATLQFNPEDVRRTNFIGQPSFWSTALESLVPNYTNGISSGSNNTVGRFQHFIEADFFEYDMFRYTGEKNVYGGTIHEWYGIWGKTCPKGFCQIAPQKSKRWVPADTDFTQFHKYGFLWVPATKRRDGYVEYYFDDRAVGARTTWSYSAKVVLPGEKDFVPYSIIDKQHFFLILGTGKGQPMTVREVRVFQRSQVDNDLLNVVMP